MALNVPAIQRALASEGVDGWLLYDFQGSNPIAAGLTGLTASSGKMTTRRWYYLVPATGEPRGLVHAIERHNLDALPGAKKPYAGRTQLEQGLKELLSGCRRVAMEYSPDCAIPYVSRVDAGTVEAVRRLGVEVVSSGDLAQRFQAVWSDDVLKTHRTASEALYRIKDRTFAAIRDGLRAGRRMTEYGIQQQMVGWFEDEGLVTDSAPIVAAQENAGNPHYAPSATAERAIRADEIVLLDLWGKTKEPGAVFADITWVGFTGARVPEEYGRAFAAARSGRDAAIALVQDAARAGRSLHGWEVDRACRDVIDRAGLGSFFIHRTGHSLGETVHGNGVHMDDYETHDERRLIPGTGFTIEPGVYTDRFGVRTEINMYVGERDATVTGPAQAEIVTLV
ncbi:MAG TPA: M24 family metallopeptidase [Vicinamibacterales bacterium]|nr:M24 family metallopeptidase [Vicinamibacterales bacterium]